MADGITAGWTSVFFRNSSAELCAAIERQTGSADTVLQQYLARIDDARLKRAFAAAIEINQPEAPQVRRSSKADSDLWRGLPSRASVRS